MSWGRPAALLRAIDAQRGPLPSRAPPGSLGPDLAADIDSQVLVAALFIVLALIPGSREDPRREDAPWPSMAAAVTAGAITLIRSEGLVLAGLPLVGI